MPRIKRDEVFAWDVNGRIFCGECYENFYTRDDPENAEPLVEEDFENSEEILICDGPNHVGNRRII